MALHRCSMNDDVPSSYFASAKSRKLRLAILSTCKKSANSSTSGCSPMESMLLMTSSMSEPESKSSLRESSKVLTSQVPLIDRSDEVTSINYRFFSLLGDMRTHEMKPYVMPNLTSIVDEGVNVFVPVSLVNGRVEQEWAFVDLVGSLQVGEEDAKSDVQQR